MRDSTELFQQSELKSKVQSPYLGNRDCEVSMRHDLKDRFRPHHAEHLYLLLIA